MLAREEDRRRRQLSTLDGASQSAGFDVVSRDEFWSDMAQRHQAILQSTYEQRTVRQLVIDFAIAERRFSEAYLQYGNEDQKLRDQQQSVRTLETISRIGTLVSSAIQVGKLASAKSGSTVTAPSTDSAYTSKSMIEYHEKQIDLLKGSLKEWRGQLEVRGATVQQLNDQLVKAFQEGGVDVPDVDKKFVLPPRR